MSTDFEKRSFPLLASLKAGLSSLSSAYAQGSSSNLFFLPFGQFIHAAHCFIRHQFVRPGMPRFFMHWLMCYLWLCQRHGGRTSSDGCFVSQPKDMDPGTREIITRFQSCYTASSFSALDQQGSGVFSNGLPSLSLEVG